MRKDKIFENDKYIISTPDLEDEDNYIIGRIDVFLNTCGKLVTSVTRKHGGTGYYAETINSVCMKMDDDVLSYLLKSLQCEKQRRINNSKTYLKHYNRKTACLPGRNIQQ